MTKKLCNRKLVEGQGPLLKIEYLIFFFNINIFIVYELINDGIFYYKFILLFSKKKIIKFYSFIKYYKNKEVNYNSEILAYS